MDADTDPKFGERIKLIEFLIKDLDSKSNGKGARWEELVPAAQMKGITVEYEVEEILNILLDRGTIWEPSLGRLKVTE